MAESEGASLATTFQKWLPLKLVSVSEIPHPTHMVDTGSFASAELAALIQNMIAVCKKERGVGLAAVQCGIPIDLFIASSDGQNFRCFYNASYSSDAQKEDSLESCLSLYDKNGKLRRFLVKRYPSVRFKAKEILLNESPATIRELDEDFSGLFGVVCQHESDHGMGILISDHGKEVEVLY